MLSFHDAVIVPIPFDAYRSSVRHARQTLSPPRRFQNVEHREAKGQFQTHAPAAASLRLEPSAGFQLSSQGKVCEPAKTRRAETGTSGMDWDSVTSLVVSSFPQSSLKNVDLGPGMIA